MKQFKTIYKHELAGHIKNKAFVGVTIFLVLVVVAISFLPRLLNSSSSDTEGGGKKDKIGLLVESGVDVEQAKEALLAEERFAGCEIMVEKDVETLKNLVMVGDYKCGFAIHDAGHFTYFVDDLSFYDSSMESFSNTLKKLNFRTALKEKGMSAAEIEKISNIEIVGEPVALGSNQAQNYFYAYIMIFALYMIIILYGQMIATNVASEKSSRAMEVLITSAKPTALMFGKILAACTAGMGQLILIFGGAYASFKFNESYIGEGNIIRMIFNIPLELIIYMIVFSLLGFLLYAMLFGAVGSMATKVEDINTLQTPITILFVIGFLIVVMNMGTNVNSGIMIVASYFPFTSPMAMFTRIAMGEIPTYEFVISIAILTVSVIGCGIFAARIYRAGVLHYGKPPKFMEMLAKAKKGV
ncbi:MAG: ABC transporter permease [Eubacterium sp.]|nr:ABC transporter permease [Eubacterium sp.]